MISFDSLQISLPCNYTRRSIKMRNPHAGWRKTGTEEGRRCENKIKNRKYRWGRKRERVRGNTGKPKERKNQKTKCVSCEKAKAQDVGWRRRKNERWMQRVGGLESPSVCLLISLMPMMMSHWRSWLHNRPLAPPCLQTPSSSLSR